ncbi:unnamed protein product [Sphagnum troendelagicum]|uniref:Uncharacterized protein n=1 Tax=Sphagnum troendelagicum TaxID=128251 RepID=A0ABP0U6D1_9BRYO
MIAKLLVNGTFNHNSISGKEESQQGEASTSSSTCSGVPVDEGTPYEELEGRGWQVVNVIAFESLVKVKVPPGVPHFMAAQAGATCWIPGKIEQAMLHGSFSHIIYIEEIGDVSEAEKLVHTVITRMLKAMREYLVAIIVETNAQSTQLWNLPQDVNGRFKSWKTLLRMQFPNVSNQPGVEAENVVVRYKSLRFLEETLVIFLELKWELSSPQKILLVVDCSGAHDAIAQNWTWGELQVVNTHHVGKNTGRLSLNTGQWKEDLEYTSETRDTDGRLYMRFLTDVTRSNEDVRNHIFLDNIREDDTLILWLCPPPLESQSSFSWCGARMRVEA